MKSPTDQLEKPAEPPPQESRRAALHPELRLLELAERNPSPGGRELLREIIERGPHLAPHEPAPARDLASVLRLRSLDDSDYRTPVEQASQLHQASPTLRELYERGATVKGETLILPAEAHELAEERAQPFLTTLAYAQQKLADPEPAKEFHALARTISGTRADARTELTVFKIYYDRLGRDERGERIAKGDAESQQKAIVRTLAEMRELAREMAQLETRESVEIEQRQDGNERAESHASGILNVAARTVDLRAEALRWPAGLSAETKERLLTKTLPELDYRLERGVPRTELLRAIDRSMQRPDAEVSQLQRTEIGGFLKQYLDERLREPETRAAHTSAAFRQARAAFQQAKTVTDVSRAAEDFWHTQRDRAKAQWLHLADPANHPPPPIKPLEVRERNLLFYGRAPAHYTSEMRELRIHYGLTQAERAARVTQLREGSLAASPPLTQLLDELVTRRTVKAVSHFQASLLNEQVAQPNRLNLYQLEQRLPPYERAYLFELTQQRKQELQIQLVRPPATVQEISPTRGAGELPRASESFREYLAHLGRIERQLLNAALDERAPAQTRQERLTITAARERLPEPIAQQIRFQASQLAWQELTPREALDRNPSPAAARVRETIAFLQEELQSRARLAQAARDELLVPSSLSLENQTTRASRAPSQIPAAKVPSVVSQEATKLSAIETARLAALEHYAVETREAFYGGFELLDQQRAALAQERSAEAPLRETSAHISRETNQPWQFDRLRDVLVIGRTGTDFPYEREAAHLTQIAPELER